MKAYTFLFVIFLACLALIEVYVGQSPQGSLLFNISFWLALCQGSVALVAAAELSEGKWIKPLKHHLFGVVPMLFFCSFAFLFMAAQWEIYPIHNKNSFWFNKTFFLARNFLFLFLSFITAWKYSRQSLMEKENKSTWAILYLFSFVISQSLLAFDCIMPLEYPWFSTIYGPYFFVEAIYIGIAFAGIYCLVLEKKPSPENLPALEKAQYDTGALLFGFSVLWMGFCFFQLIVIWYGNIPEEVSFYTYRLSNPFYKGVGYAILAMFFFLPFMILINKKAKKNPYIVATTSCIIFLALFLERSFILFPVAKITFVALVLELIVFTLVFATIILTASRSRQSLKN
ncbi:MAG: hypothetical protein HUU50_16720 [Candidatus Brocadiae bacterium]|nr:hypothetical protein [Candidatus Brocadiia bacterium]